jgi:hypothetical protein
MHPLFVKTFGIGLCDMTNVLRAFFWSHLSGLKQNNALTRSAFGKGFILQAI